jgi:hypothetical protein
LSSKAGYLRRTWLRGDKGQYIGREWEVFENPVMTDGLTDSGFSVSGEAVSGKPGTNKNNNNKINNNREEEETKIAEEQKEVLPTSNSDYEPEVNAPPHSYPDSFYEEPASPQQIHGSNSKDLIEAVKKKLGIEDTLAFLLVARCQDKLDNVIDQLVNAKKPIQNMTAYLLTLMSRPEQWDLFIENVENGFLTKERPKKKRRELKPKYLEEEREIYIPPSARNG